MAASHTPQVRALYRRIIRNAKVFPSVGRHRLIKEIREGEVMMMVLKMMMVFVMEFVMTMVMMKTMMMMMMMMEEESAF